MTRETNRRKIFAVLGGGLVLGIGAAVTLAAWNDSEFATGTFAAGSFNLEGATDGADGTYSDHASAGAAASLEFTLPLAENLAPEDVVYAPFWVRLDADTTTGATLMASSAEGTDTTGANAAELSYDVYAIDPSATCDATATAGTQVATGTDLDDFTAVDTVTLLEGSAGAAGTPVQLCFIVTAGADLEQGGETSATWSFTATSTT
ncbi:MAG: SipW-dependent-type signal peptide-containing protein [Microbacterium sp.]